MKWTPSLERKSQFTSIGPIKGKILGNVFLADSKDIAISFSEYPSKIKDCEKELIITDQGLAIKNTQFSEIRSKRLNPSGNLTGVVESPQLASQLTALRADITDAVNNAFRHMLLLICENIDHAFRQIRTLITTNSTISVRQLTKRHDLHARGSNDFIEVWPCVKLPVTNMIFNKFNRYLFRPLIRLNQGRTRMS